MIVEMMRGGADQALAKNLANESGQLRNHSGFARRNKAELVGCTQF
jgi:hypothetical protein